MFGAVVRSRRSSSLILTHFGFLSVLYEIQKCTFFDMTIFISEWCGGSPGKYWTKIFHTLTTWISVAVSPVSYTKIKYHKKLWYIFKFKPFELEIVLLREIGAEHH